MLISLVRLHTYLSTQAPQKDIKATINQHNTQQQQKRKIERERGREREKEKDRNGEKRERNVDEHCHRLRL